MNTFGCFGDVAGRAVALSTVPQILLDGANGVGQAPRTCAAVEPVLVLAFFAALLGSVFATRRGAGRGPRRWIILCAVVAVSYIPGWFHVLKLRADRPSAQHDLANQVVNARTSYDGAMTAVLATVPEGTCFAPTLDPICVPFGALYLAADADLLPHRRCIGGEPATIAIAISACGPGGITARIRR